MIQCDQMLASHIFTVERRREDRAVVIIPTSIMLPGRRLMSIEIENISEGGIFARLPEPLNERDRARIDLPGIGWIPAQVVWAMRDGHGFAFDAPVERHKIDVLTFIYRQFD